MITSTANPQVKQLVQWQSEAKARRRDGVFVVEGVKMLEEAPADRIRDIYLTEELEQRLWDGKSEREKALWSKIKQNGYETLSFEVMKKAADTQTPQGVLAVLERPVYEKEEMLAVKNGFFLVLEDLQDPGNLGTVWRTADAFGAAGLLLTGNCADPFGPKAVRASMGACFRLPVWKGERGAVAGLAQLGLLPTRNSRLSPKANLTRADMALLLHRAMTQ